MGWGAGDPPTGHRAVSQQGSMLQGRGPLHSDEQHCSLAGTGLSRASCMFSVSPAPEERGGRPPGPWTGLGCPLLPRPRRPPPGKSALPTKGSLWGFISASDGKPPLGAQEAPQLAGPSGHPAQTSHADCCPPPGHAARAAHSGTSSPPVLSMGRVEGRPPPPHGWGQQGRG